MITADAVLSIWHDIEPSAQDAYLEWHTLEHMPERASIDGFVRGRRGVALDPAQSPKYLTLYEAREAEIFRSTQYLERLDNPTPWTQRIQPSFQNFVRYANVPALQKGFGDGAFVTTARIEAVGDATATFAQLEARLRALVDELGELPKVSSVFLGESRDEITDYKTEEAELRPVNPDLDGVRHLAVIFVDTLTADAAGPVREKIEALAAELGDARIGHCSTFLVDYMVDETHVTRTPFDADAIERRSK